MKCAQYWPAEEEEVMTFSETGFRVRLVSEDVKSYYTVHLLQLENINVSFSQSVQLLFMGLSVSWEPLSMMSLQVWLSFCTGNFNALCFWECWRCLCGNKWVRPQSIHWEITSLPFVCLYFPFGSTLTCWILNDGSGDSKRSLRINL